MNTTRLQPPAAPAARRARGALFAVVLAALAPACAARAPAAPNAIEEELPPTRPVASTAPDQLGTLPPGTGLPSGTPAPDATLEDATGQTVRLGDWVGEGWVLVVFYRGGWCPYCNHQIRELSFAAPRFEERGITPLLVSVDRTEEAARTQASWEIPFPVLADPDLHAHEAFGVVHQAEDAEVARLTGFGIDLEAASGRTHHRFAVPSMFLIDSTGTIRWAHADPDYKIRPTPEQVLEVHRGLVP